MKTLKQCKDEVARKAGHKNWKELDFVFSGKIPSVHANSVSRLYATEAIKADRERVAENAKTKYVRFDDPKANFHGEDVVDKESILNLPIELP